MLLDLCVIVMIGTVCEIFQEKSEVYSRMSKQLVFLDLFGVIYSKL